MEENVAPITIEEFVPQRIEEICKERNLSQYRLCQFTGIAQSSLSTMKKGKTHLSFYSVDRICTGLGITIFEFFSPSTSPGTLITKEERLCLKYWNQLDDNQKQNLLAFAKGMLLTSEFRQLKKN